MIRTLSAAAAFAVLGGAAIAAPVQFQPGEWTANISMTAMGQTFNESMTDCMGADEANMEPTALAQEFAGGAECTATNVQQSGNRVTFSMTCPGQAMAAADITLEYQSTSFTMNGDVTLDVGQGQTVPAQMVVNANYQGACTSY